MKRSPAQALNIRSVTLLVCGSVLACSGPESRPVLPGQAETEPWWERLKESSWEWTEAQCVDGPLDLASRGFTQRLRIRGAPNRLLIIEDSELASEGCSRTVVRRARPGSEPGSWLLQEQARISLPPEANCGDAPERESRGVFRVTGKLLELLLYRSAWCGGFDARFAYRQTAPRPLSAAELVRHWAAHFNRRDAEATSLLFAATGSLVEPFTPTAEGIPKRHDGRAAIRRWYQEAFASVPWLALRLLSMTDGGRTGHHVVEWQYMDPLLAKPFGGRNLFIIAGGEIFETETQLTTEIVSTGKDAL